jgi:hypothetical protein
MKARAGGVKRAAGGLHGRLTALKSPA